MTSYTGKYESLTPSRLELGSSQGIRPQQVIHILDQLFSTPPEILHLSHCILCTKLGPSFHRCTLLAIIRSRNLRKQAN
jgi:hypothetical protein